jgi:hypothetical protein
MMKSERSSMTGRGGAWVAVAAVAAGLMLVAGCASQEDSQSSSSTPADQTLLVAQSGHPTGTSTGGVATEGASGSGAGMAAASADSLPPDVSATVADTLVFPGSSIEITAVGSPDVVSVSLGDGLGGKQPFAYDATSDSWKIFYRVPVKPGTERVALSVTARNASQRWRRVWLFLGVQQERPAAQADSTVKP